MTPRVRNGTGLWRSFTLRLGRPSELTRITLRGAPADWGIPPPKVPILLPGWRFHDPKVVACVKVKESDRWAALEERFREMRAAAFRFGGDHSSRLA